MTLEPYLYSSPAVILIVAVMLVPLALGLSYAFRDMQLLDPFSGGFVGLEHFRELLGDRHFFRAFGNTLWWTFGSLVFQFLLGFMLAMILNRPFPGKRVAQALVFLPWAVPTFLSGLNWAWLFNPVVGPLPHWLFGSACSPRRKTSSPIRRPPCGGRSSPMSGTASPSSRSPCSPRCSRSRTSSTRRPRSTAPRTRNNSARITLPFLAPTIAITLMLRTVWIANFADLIVVMTNGGPADSTQIVASYIFTQAFRRLDFGYASAIAAVLLALLLLYSLAIITLRRSLLKAG